ncbi:hypothetical protein QR680_004841 [Steinernema hermaphroditum]|uniref:Uncharacterized protein n=1 Tax=Steinernema hermaphroditum TaxID=289476 RepID=A0AA39HQ05_9BILA|nr:hypothetical protein QR680_004834 [Steinernema hermaphroditum]KAK0409926.1 hypothetical protein QR680_004841 [Steinernema hermaphroditum]
MEDGREEISAVSTAFEQYFVFLEIDIRFFSAICWASAVFWLLVLVVLLYTECARMWRRVMVRSKEQKKMLPMYEISGANVSAEATRYNETMAKTYFWRDAYRPEMALLTNVTHLADQEGMYNKRDV